MRASSSSNDTANARISRSLRLLKDRMIAPFLECGGCHRFGSAKCGSKRVPCRLTRSPEARGPAALASGERVKRARPHPGPSGVEPPHSKKDPKRRQPPHSKLVPPKEAANLGARPDSDYI